MKSKKLFLRFICVFALLALLNVTIVQQASAVFGFSLQTASQNTASGKIGKEVSWSFNKRSGKLVISGKGSIPDYDSVSQTPWYRYKSSVKSLEIKSGITKIGNSAFYSFSSLENLKVAPSVIQIGATALDGTKWLEAKGDGAVYINKVLYTYIGRLNVFSNFSIRSDTVSISPFAFAFQSGLSSVTIPASTKTIGTYAFAYCENLRSLAIQNGVKTIGDGAFNVCTALKSVSVPKSVTAIGNYAFAYCEQLEKISLTQGLRSVGEGAFSYTAIRSIVLPQSVSSVAKGLFSGCQRLEKITVSEKSKYYSSDKSGVLYNKQKTKLIAYPAASSLTYYTVNPATTEIVYEAFSGAKNLRRVTLQKAVKTIGENAFVGCVNIENFGSYQNVSYLYDQSLTQTKWFSNQADGAVYFGKSFCAYKGDAKKDFSFSIKKGTVSVAPYAFYGCKRLKSVTFPVTLKIIGKNAFGGCSALQAITLPVSLTKIGAYAFSGCSKIKQVTLKANVASLEDGAFSGCTALKTLTVENPLCAIASTAVPKQAVVKGRKNSTAEAFAEKNGLKFTSLSAIKMSECTVSQIKTQKYNGKAQTPAVTVKYGGKALTKGKHYTVSYSSNKNVGTASVTVKGNAAYGFSGTVKTTFKISR